MVLLILSVLSVSGYISMLFNIDCSSLWNRDVYLGSVQNGWSHDVKILDRGVHGVPSLPYCLGIRTGQELPVLPLLVAYACPNQGICHNMAVSIGATNKDHTSNSVSVTVDSKRRAIICQLGKFGGQER